VKVLHIYTLERNIAVKHCEENHTSAPHINSASFISFLCNNLRGYISRGSTLIK
jgi:hypothetical protein